LTQTFGFILLTDTIIHKLTELLAKANDI